MKEIKDTKALREFYGLTLIIVPTVIVAISAMYIVNVFARATALAILLFLQAVIVRGMLQNKYE